MTNAKGWSYSAGTRGKNRVRVYEARSGVLYAEYWERDDDTGKLARRRQSLSHRDHARATRQADAIAARLTVDPVRGTGEITLGSLFDIYEAEVTPRKGAGKQGHDRRTASMFRKLWGADRLVGTLSLREWDQFIDLRRAGRIGPGANPRPVRNRQIEYDLRWIRAVLRWATLASVDGKPLLDRDPFAGYPLPKERSPARPAMTEAQYQALRRVAPSMNWRFEVALVVVHETGHRLKAVRHLRWSDIDLEQGRIRWRAEHDKIGFEHVTPISPTLQTFLEALRRRTSRIGDTWLLPSTRFPDRCCPKGTLDCWFGDAIERAGLTLPRGARWHSLRRKFATEMKHLPLRDLAYLGGWKEPKTLLQCYQQPDEDLMRNAFGARKTFGESVVSIAPDSIDTIAECTG